MKTLLLLNLIALPALAQTPELTSTVPGLTIRNSHTVAGRQIYRGSQPLTKVKELKPFGITDVLIIKNQTKNEVDTEISALNDLGIRSTVIPLNWQDPDLKKTCTQVVEAVKTLQAFKQNQSKAYFHCTAGEDRTGLVAALFRMVDQGWNTQKAFRQEMCGHGYSDGNPNKPQNVINLIEKNLTPVFMVLSRQLDQTGKLDARACASLSTATQARISVLTCQ
jgi:protein tyrosine/serine phosphatase